MDLKGSLVDTHVRIYPSDKLVEFIKSIPPSDVVPHNILKIIKPNTNGVSEFKIYKLDVLKPVHFNNSEIENLKKIKEIYVEAHKEESSQQKGVDKKENHIDKNIEKEVKEEELKTTKKDPNAEKEAIENKLNKLFSTETENLANNETKKLSKESLNSDASESKDDRPFFVTSDIDWLYGHLKSRRNNGDNDVPYLHALLEGASIEMPKNETLKRNPILEARCVKLRAQQEAREYRKMTKSVDNVRMRFPEDSISYQMKQLNRHLIAIGQFIISIFAGFLFGFRGVEWMVGNLDFGFRLLLGVMCALVIALAEIYFLAKKLNEELCVPETVQLGGPVKFADQDSYNYKNNDSPTETKPHQD